MIRLEGVHAQIGSFTLDGVNLEIPQGGYGLVIGPSGCGKTSLLEVIAGYIALQGGRVVIQRKDVTREPPERRGIGFVYQRYNLFPHLSVRENMRYGIVHSRLSEAQQHHRVEELAEMLGVTTLLDRGIEHLSGGETQRVAIARALAPKPRVLLLDEPFASLDPVTRRQLRLELLALQRHEKVTTVQVTHDFEEALQLGGLVAVMASGRIIQQGAPEVVFQQPNSEFVARFLGAANVIAGSVVRDADSVDPEGRFAARFASGPLQLSVLAEREGETHAVLPPESLTLSREAPSGSARNVFSAIIVSLEDRGPITNVTVDAGIPLLVSITRESAHGMRLACGERVVVSVKATAIHLV